MSGCAAPARKQSWRGDINAAWLLRVDPWPEQPRRTRSETGTLAVASGLGCRLIALRCCRHFALRRALRRAARLVGRPVRGLRGGAGDRQFAFELFEPLGADPLDVLQLLDRFEAAMRIAVIEDRLRLRGADSGQADELLLRRRVEVERGKRGAGPQRKRER